MKRLGKTIFSFTAAFALLVPAAHANTASFSDVPEDYWAAEAIGQFTSTGVIQGFEDGTFRPHQPITRAQTAVIIAGELDTNNPQEVDYQDVTADHYASDAIAAVTDAGIMIGSNDHFNPDDELTRAEMAVVLTNAFGFEGNQEVNFTDVDEDLFAYDSIDALVTNDVTAGYPDNTFKPNEPTTRAELAVFLAEATSQSQGEDNAAGEEEEANEQSVTELLKDAYDNEMNLSSYDFTSNMNFGISLPDSMLTEPGAEELSNVLENMEFSISGSYQKDPMMMEMDFTFTIPGDVETNITMPVIMTEDKMWMQLPQSPVLQLPPELQGTYIEYDLAELAEMNNQPASMYDMDLQTEMATAIYDMTIEHFGEDFYQIVNQNVDGTSSDGNGQQVVHFELNNENLSQFIDILLTEYMPDYFELMKDPEFREAMGFTQLTDEDVETAQDAFESVNFDTEAITDTIQEYVTINNFDEYLMINQNNVITSNTFDMDLDIALDQGTLGLELGADTDKSNINGNVSIDTPDSSEVITMEELEQLSQEAMQQQQTEQQTSDQNAMNQVEQEEQAV